MAETITISLETTTQELTLYVDQAARGPAGADGAAGPAGEAGEAGPPGETGPAGSDAEVTNANVNAAIETDPAASRTSLGLGSTDSPTFASVGVSDGDVEISTIGNGVVLKSPDATRWLLTINNSGAIVTTAFVSYDRYVSPTGSDLAAGTLEEPWQTLGRIVTYAQGSAVSATLTLSAVSGTVTATRSNGVFSANDIGRCLYAIAGTGAGTITAVGTTTCTLQVTSTFASTTVSTGQWAIAEMLDGVTSTVRVMEGTYTDQSCNIARAASAADKATRLEITCDEGTAIQWTLGTDQSCWQAGGSNWAMDVSGYGCSVTGFNAGTGNGIGSSGSVTMIGRGWTISDCVDGISGHNSSRIEGYDLTISNCSKSGFQHINTVQSYHYRCSFTGKSGASAGIGQLDATAQGYFEDCEFIPITAGQSIGVSDADLVRCKIGTLSLRAVIAGSETTTTSIQDSFFNAAIDGRWVFNLLRCYGKLSLRLRGSTTNPDFAMDHCVWVGGATGSSNNAIYADTDLGATWQGNGYGITNTVFKGFTTAIGGGFSSNQYSSFNATSTVGNCCFNGNTTNVHASISVATDSLVADPVLGSCATTSQEDWAIDAASPCIAAGTSGSNIGFSVADIPA